MRAMLMVGLLLITAACGRGDEETATAQETRAPAQAKGEPAGTSFAARADAKTGAVELAFPGAKLSLDLPIGEALSSGDMDIDGTKLYPGSTVERMDVRASEGVGKAEDRAHVRIDFLAPASPDVVRAWFLSSTASNKRPLRAAGDALIGATEKGKAYRIALAPANGGKTSGSLVLDE